MDALEGAGGNLAGLEVLPDAAVAAPVSASAAVRIQGALDAGAGAEVCRALWCLLLASPVRAGGRTHGTKTLGESSWRMERGPCCQSACDSGA